METKERKGFSLRVGEQGAGITGDRANGCQVLGFAVADDGQRTAFFSKGRLLLRQFSDLLTAEYSAEMADENKNGRLVLPQGAQFDAVIALVENNQFAETFYIDVHGKPLLMFGTLPLRCMEPGERPYALTAVPFWGQGTL